MLAEIHVNIPQHVVRNEMKQFSIRLQGENWEAGWAHRPGARVPIIMDGGIHSHTVTATWDLSPCGDATPFLDTRWPRSGQRCLIPATSYLLKKKSDFADWATTEHRVARAGRDWFTLGATYTREPGGAFRFAVVADSPNPDLAGITTLEPLIVPPQAWSTWLAGSAGQHSYPLNRGMLEVVKTSLH